MTERIVKPSSFFAAIKEIILLYGHVFPHILGLVVIAAIIQAIVSAIIPENPTIGLTVSIFSAVIAMFFYAWILYHADNILMDRHETIKDSLKVAKKRFIPLLGVLAFYLVFLFVYGMFGFGMQLLGNLFHAQILFGIITAVILIFILTLLAFSMPSVIIDNFPILKSFEHSVKLVWTHWWHVFGVFLVFVVPVVLLSLAVLLFHNKNIYLLTLYEFMYHIITYPLMIALILVLYHDLKARYQVGSFKHLDQDARIIHK